MKTLQIILEGPGGELDRRTIEYMPDAEASDLSDAIHDEIREFMLAAGDVIRIVEVDR